MQTNTTLRFYPNTRWGKYCIAREALGTIACLAVALFFVISVGRSIRTSNLSWSLCVFIGVIAISVYGSWVTSRQLVALLGCVVQITSHNVSLTFKDAATVISFADIVAIRTENYPTGRELQLFTQELEFSIPHWFDLQSIEQALGARLTSMVFGEDAMMNVDTYRFEVEQARSVVSNTNTHYTVRINLLFWLLVSSIAFAAIPASTSSNGRIFSILCALPVTVMVLCLLALGGIIRIDSEQIVVRGLIASFGIRWNEIHMIETDANSASLVLWGKNKHLVIYGYSYWSGKEADIARQYVESQFVVRKVHRKYSQKALFRLQHNTRL